MRSRIAATIVAALLAAPAWSQAPARPGADPCTDCRAAAAAGKQRCDAAAKASADFDACAKRITEAMLACQVGACKPGLDAQMAAMCPDCQHRAAEEEKTCRSMAAGSAEQVSCNQRVGRMRVACEEKYCKLAPK